MLKIKAKADKNGGADWYQNDTAMIDRVEKPTDIAGFIMAQLHGTVAGSWGAYMLILIDGACTNNTHWYYTWADVMNEWDVID